MEKFDKTKEFENEVAPLMKALGEKCREHGIPCFVSIMPYDDDERTNTRTMCYFGGDVMQNRDCTNQLAVLRDISEGVPMDLLVLFEMLIHRFRLEQHKRGKEDAPKTERSEGTGDPLQEAMLDQVLKQIYGDGSEKNSD